MEQTDDTITCGNCAQHRVRVTEYIRPKGMHEGPRKAYRADCEGCGDWTAWSEDKSRAIEDIERKKHTPMDESIDIIRKSMEYAVNKHPICSAIVLGKDFFDGLAECEREKLARGNGDYESIMLEEVYEALHEIKHDNHTKAIEELSHVAVVAIRGMIYLMGEIEKGYDKTYEET